jgi:DNA-binding response OmpR family regulator
MLLFRQHIFSRSRRNLVAARILVVNDTQEILELFRMLLEGEGYEVILAGFPIQQVGDVERINPDLIILDFVFGDQKSGWQMLQMLKMQRSTASIPVIVCTAALDMVREQEGYLVSQGVHVVFKPFDIDHLLTNVTRLLGSHEHVASTSEEEGKKKK